MIVLQICFLFRYLVSFLRKFGKFIYITGAYFCILLHTFCKFGVILQVSAVTFPLMESLKICIELWMRCNLYRFSKNPPELLLTEKSSYSLKIDIYHRIPHVLYLLGGANGARA